MAESPKMDKPQDTETVDEATPLAGDSTTNAELPRATFAAIKNAKDLGEVTTLEIPDWGVSVEIRPMTRYEVVRMGEISLTVTRLDAEIYVLRTAVIDPVLTEEEAREILTTKSHGATEPIFDAILASSNLEPGAVRAAQYSFLGEEGV